MPPGPLMRLLMNMEKTYKPGTLSRDEINLLASSYSVFLEKSLETLKKFRILFSHDESEYNVTLKEFLKVHNLIAQSKLYKSASPFENELSTRLYKTIKLSAEENFSNELKKVEGFLDNNDLEDPHSLLTKYLGIIKALNLDLIIIEDFYQDVFMREGHLELFQITYKVYSRKVFKLIFKDNSMQNLQQSHNVFFRDFDSFDCYRNFINFFSIFSSIQQFYSYQDYLVVDGFDTDESIDHQRWFGGVFEQWIKYAKHMIEKKIDFLIDSDELSTITDSSMMCSMSAVNFVASLELAIQIWKRLQWTDVTGKMVYVTALTESFGSCGLMFADTLHEKVRLAGYFDECGQFDLSTQICITLNNINSIEKCLQRLPHDLGFDQLAAEIALSSGERLAGRSILESLNFIAKQSWEHISGVSESIVHRVTSKMRPEIRKNVFHLCWSPQSVSVQKAVNDLLVYLSENVGLIKTQLHQGICCRVVLALWTEVLGQMQEQAQREFYEEEDGDGSSAHGDSSGTENLNSSSSGAIDSLPQRYIGSEKLFVIARLFRCLDILRDFFLSTDDSLTELQLETDNYRTLKYMLTLYQLNPKDAVAEYFREKLEEQETVDKDNYGYLSLRIFFKRSSGTLAIEVLKATGLTPLDSNGLSDPFVILELAPSHYFSSANKVIKTKVIKNTLEPEFNEYYEIPIRLDQISKPGAALVCTVMDKDLLISDDLEGVVFVALDSVPGLHTEIRDASTVPIISMPLIMPRYQVNKALSVLERYKLDSYAHEICKKWLWIEKSTLKE